ncbi:MAG TPA: exodeoxyribonuclease VII large subunit [Planktothrix sp.]
MYSTKPNQSLNAVLTVSQLTAQLRDVLEREFQQVYVVGEVSNAKVYPSGHCYFSLKDKDATLPCVCFRSDNAMLKFKIEDGLMVVARGRMNVYQPKGSYQLVAVSLEPVGIGEWQLAFEQLRQKLEAEGLLHRARKRPIPMMPRRVGIITSPAGAAIRDVLSALYRRNRYVNAVVAPVKVQGEGSAEDVAAAIEWLHRIPNVDVIIIARGGGSIEDLWSFNTEIVARAIVDSAIPIISGIGHETDITICDLVADLRAPTPTAAAELVAKGSAELLERWTSLQKQLLLRTDARLARARRALDRLKPLQVLLRYGERLKRDSQKVAYIRQRIDRAIDHALIRSRQDWHKQQEKLLVLGPQNVLNRGFAIIKRDDGSVVNEASSVQVGDSLVALLANGKLRLRVESVNPDDETGPPSQLKLPLKNNSNI